MCACTPQTLHGGWAGPLQAGCAVTHSIAECGEEARQGAASHVRTEGVAAQTLAFANLPNGHGLLLMCLPGHVNTAMQLLGTLRCARLLVRAAALICAWRC